MDFQKNTLMNYQETLDYMFNQLPMYQRTGKAAYKADLDNTLALDKHFNHPHEKFKTIHVAGTNGKGSTSHMLTSVLQKAGYKVGLYTSPHLRDFRERIKVNGEVIIEQYVIDFVESGKELFQEIKPSFFEMTVALAFNYFAEQQVDVAVIEVGLGGRLDSTNIIAPELSIITNISFDHTDFLGDTYRKIALEKAGVIKKNIPVVIGRKGAETKGVFINKAEEVQTSIYFAEDEYSVDNLKLTSDHKQSFTVKNNAGVLVYEDLKLDLLGLCQRENVITVLMSLDILKEQGFSLSKENIYQGLECASKSTGLLGRWQIIGQHPLIVCDTGHNEDGIRAIVQQIKSISYESLHVVLGVVNDKNIDTILDYLPKDAVYYFTQASIPRALDAHLLAEKAQQKGLRGKVVSNVEDALHEAKEKAGENDMVFVGGSTFVVAEVV